MNTFHFIPHTQSSITSFDEVLEQVSKQIETIPNNKQQILKETLANGLASLTTKEMLFMYLNSYGDIHRQKLLMAYERIPKKVWYEDRLAVIDYGCGQCVAGMVLSDFLKNQYVDNDIVKEFIVIEPSSECIKQGIRYLQLFYHDCNITSYNTSVSDIKLHHIDTKSRTILHIFSNVLDIPDFDREYAATLINQDKSRNHIIVCVSPFYQEKGRGALMDDFVNMIQGMRSEYTCNKHIDEWNKSFSCQIRIMVSGYY